MNSRRILSLVLALLMAFSSFAEIIPVNAFASETPETAESKSDVIASYEIPLDQVTFNEDGSMNLDLSAFEPVATESEATEPVETEPVVTEPVVTEPVETEPVVTEPVETEPVVTEPAETEPVVTEPAETEPVVTEPAAAPELLTWFQWIQEKGLDLSALTKDELGALNEEYRVYRINTLAELGELPEGDASGTVANNYIEVALYEDAHFTIGNRIGNPNYSSDDNKILLYGHPWGSTSETLISIDGEYQNYFYSDTTTYSYNTATSTMSIPGYGIKVVQTLKLIKMGSSSFEDTVQIQYQVYNNDSRNHDVGIRIMMDTMLANNDHATFHLASLGHVTDSRVFTGSAIPSQYQVYDNIQTPTTIATGHLYRSGDRKPDMVQFCNWGGIRGSSWNHVVYNGDYLGDSAVGIYFNPITVKPGKNTTVRTYYGVSLDTASGGATEVGSDQVKLTVKDSYTGEPLEGVSVSYKIGMDATVRTATTDSYGEAILTGFTSSRESVSTMITLTKEGYKRNSYRTNLRGGSSTTQQMSLEDQPKPVVNSILLDTGTTNVNLLTGTYTADEDPNDYIGKNGATGTVTIKATSDTEGCTWYLVQDEKVIQRNSSGEFTFSIREVTKDNGDKRTYIEEFTPDGNRYIQCVSPQGEKSEKMRFGLNIRAGVELKFGDLDMSKVWPGVDGTLAEGTLGALFLGNKISFGPKNSKFKVFAELTEDGVVRVGINYDIAKNDDREKGDAASTKRIENFEKNIKKQLKNFVTGKNSNIKNTLKKVGKFDYGAGTAEFIFCGYGEGQFENGAARVDVTVVLGVKADGHHTWQFMAWTVPVYVDVGAEFKAELSASANIINTEGLGFRFYNAEFSPAFSVWLEGGAGVKKALSVGVKGTATISMDWNLVTQYLRADLTGSASLVAEAFGIFEKDLEFARATVPIYDSNRDGDALGGDENIFELLEAQPFRLITREESAEGGTSQYATNARIVTVGGQQYKFFATDRGGDLSNRYMLCWSKLVDGVWTEAVPVADDGTSDLYYDVAVSGSDIYVVWSNSGRVFDDATVTLDEFAAAQEICLAVIDSTDGTCSAPLALTNDSVMDTMPAVTVLDGTAYVAWSHTANSMEDMTDVYDNYLHYTSVTGGTAGETVAVNFENASINTVSASSASGKPLATIVSNSSAEGSVQANETTVVDMSSGTRTDVDTTDKIIGKTVSGTIDGVEKTFWMENGNVAYADSITSENPTYIFAEDAIPGTITEDNYTVITVGNATYLIWSQGSGVEGVPASAMTAIYSNGTWGGVHKLTDLSTGNIVELDGYLNAEGQLVLVYTVKNIYENASGTSSMSSSSHEKTVEPEQSIRIADLVFDVADAIPGQILPLKLDVVNTGNTTVDSLELYINSEAGENYSQTLTGLNIAPGTQTTLEINDFILSSSLTTRSQYEGQYIYTVTANAAGSEIYAEETFEIGYDNVVLYKIDTAYVDNLENVVIGVENQSGFPASQVRVQILADAVDGILIYDNTFDQIAAGDMMTIYLPIEELNSSSLFAFVSTEATPSSQDDYYELILSNTSSMANLTLEAIGCGTTSPEGENLYDIGATVSIQAIPDEGYLFDGWTSNRELVYLSGDEDSAWAEIEMPDMDTILTARFVSETPYDFTLSAESAELSVGDQLQLLANFASLEETGKVTWSSSDEAVVSVSGRGIITALKPGTATVTAACGEYVHSCEITVNYVDVTDIRMVYPTLNLAVAETAAAEVLTDPENGISSLLWTSSDESVATVDQQGNVTAVGYGTAVITAAAHTNPEVTAQCTVNVILPVTDISLDQYELRMTMDRNQAELNVIYEPAEANYGKMISWTVDSSDVVSIESSGEFGETLAVTAIGFGTATITATSEEGYSVSCMVDVRDEGLRLETWDMEYTGKTLKPAFPVYYFGEQLTAGEDYTLKFSNNKNVGTATVKLTGKGEFAGETITANFRIVPGYSQLKATVDSKGIKLSWNASKGAAKYELYRNVDGQDWTLLKTLSSSTKSYTDKDTNGEHFYSYMLVPYKDVKGVRYSPASSMVGPMIKLGPVKNLKGTDDFSNDNVHLTWDALPGAEGYIVYRSENNGEDAYSVYTTETEYTADVYGSGKYEFTILPYKYVNGEQHEGAASNAYTTYRLSTPYLNTWRENKKVGMWYGINYVAGQTGIQIYRSSDGGKTWKSFKTVKCTDNRYSGYLSGNLTDTGAKSEGTTYQYRARSYVTVGKKNYYGDWSAISTCLGVPAISSVKTAAEGGLNLTWKKVPGAEWYEIHRYYNDGNGGWNENTFTYRVTDPAEKTHTFHDDYATDPGQYQYQIQAYAANPNDSDDAFESQYSKPKYGYVLNTPNLNGVWNASKGTELSWTWGNFTRGFEVYRSTNYNAETGAGTWKKLKTITNSTYLNDTSATKNGTIYSYKVRAFYKEGSATFYSDFTQPQSICKMSPPKLKSLKVRADGGFDITFNTVKDADGFEIVRWRGEGEYSQDSVILANISNTGAKTYTVNDPEATDKNTVYQYIIHAYRYEDNGSSSVATTYAYGYHYGQSEVNVENTEKGIMVYAYVRDSYNYNYGYANSFTIYRSENGGSSYKTLKTVKTDWYGYMAYNDTTAKAGKTYIYKVKPSGKGGFNAFTAEMSEPTAPILCKPGPKISSLTNAIGGMTVSWKAQTGMPAAAEYIIYRSQDNFNYQPVGSVNAETFTFTDYSADIYNYYYIDDNLYYYKVAAIPADESQPVTYSKPQKILYVHAPSDLDSWSPSATTAEIYWDGSGYWDGYEIRYTTGSTTKTVKNKQTLTGLKAGKTYEISMRMYFKYDGKTYYSAWSEPYYLEK